MTSINDVDWSIDAAPFPTFKEWFENEGSSVPLTSNGTRGKAAEYYKEKYEELKAFKFNINAPPFIPEAPNICKPKPFPSFGKWYRKKRSRGAQVIMPMSTWIDMYEMQKTQYESQ